MDNYKNITLALGKYGSFTIGVAVTVEGDEKIFEVSYYDRFLIDNLGRDSFIFKTTCTDAIDAPKFEPPTAAGVELLSYIISALPDLVTP
ncbi:MAG TPA: hypothetical protein VL093_13355 [Flavipsychrobacter sp.]|nr:hypothetical protein [Flavipsychrobacter sp.]